MVKLFTTLFSNIYEINKIIDVFSFRNFNILYHHSTYAHKYHVVFLKMYSINKTLICCTNTMFNLYITCEEALSLFKLKV